MNANNKITLEEHRQAMTSLKKCFTEGMEILNILENATIVPKKDDQSQEDVLKTVHWKWFNNEIKNGGKVTVPYLVPLKNGEGYLVPKSKIEHIDIFAGKYSEGSRHGYSELDAKNWLSKRYKYDGDPDNWFHAKGKGIIVEYEDYEDDDFEKAEIHWFECETIGAVGIKWHEDTYKAEGKGVNNIMPKTYMFTESGIDLGDGEVETGKVFEIAKKAKELYENNKLLEFERYVLTEAEKLPEDDGMLLMDTRLSESTRDDVLGILGEIDYLKHGNDDYVLAESGMVPRE